MNTKRRAIFLDRDGVINDVVDRGENFFVLEKKVRFTAPFSYEEFHMKDGVCQALDAIHKLGFLCILVTNQPDVTYKMLPIADHERIMSEVAQLPFDDIFVCTHGRYDNCECKKPKPGMIIAAMKKHKIDTASSYMVGDTKSDIDAGKSAGIKTIIIDYPQNKDLIANYRIKHIQELPQFLNLKF